MGLTPFRNNVYTVGDQRQTILININKKATNNMHLETDANHLLLGRIIEIVIKDTDQNAPYPIHYTLSTKIGSHPHQYTKPTLQSGKTVEFRPTAADKNKKKPEAYEKTKDTHHSTIFST